MHRGTFLKEPFPYRYLALKRHPWSKLSQFAPDMLAMPGMLSLSPLVAGHKCQIQGVGIDMLTAPSQPTGG